ncbi:hypothetical protein SAY87_002841 [Trapa incisa]|uniref:Cytochrome P450 n=1 Tax=Trapa incisa TaxID=236973 RepID=A0AAN7KJJ5_9MYRT|nr:hypothetical protein SAY87_002841 [Trapa incisa]
MVGEINNTWTLRLQWILPDTPLWMLVVECPVKVDKTRPAADMFLAYFFLFTASYAVLRHLIHKVRNLPPSPFPTLPVIGHLYLLKKPLHRTLKAIAARHGSVLLLQFGSRRVLIASSPSAAEDCLNKNDTVFANRPHLLAGKYLGYNYTSLAWSSYGDHWRNLRRIASLEILSTHRLNCLAGIRANEVAALVRRLARKDDPTLPVDLKTALFGLMMNVLMRMIAGKRYYGENVEEVEEAKSFREIVTETFRIGGATNIGEFLPFLRKIGFKETEPDYYKDIFIRSIMLVLLAAGTDTSAATLEWAMSLLLNYPEVLKKAQAEIDVAVGSSRLVNESDLAGLPYLHCIIKEMLRMYPAGPLLLPHESSVECDVGGHRVPRGTMLLVNLYSIQRDPKYWPEPERFEGMEGVRDGHKMMPFGAGRRGCPGENLALRMVGVTLGSLIQCFEWDRVGEEPVDMTEGTGLTMPKAQPLFARCRTRESMRPLLSHI